MRFRQLEDWKAFLRRFAISRLMSKGVLKVLCIGTRDTILAVRDVLARENKGAELHTLAVEVAPFPAPAFEFAATAQCDVCLVDYDGGLCRQICDCGQ
jgi:hypothetical protein